MSTTMTSVSRNLLKTLPKPLADSWDLALRSTNHYGTF